MSSVHDSRGGLESQGVGSDSRIADWKKHRLRTASDHWEDDKSPPDPGVHRKHVEPWLAALLQAEHVSLLVGNGLTTAIADLRRTAPGVAPAGIRTSRTKSARREN